MTRTILWSLIVTGFYVLPVLISAQPTDDRKADLIFYADVLVNATESANRQRAQHAFLPLLKQQLETNGFSESLSDLPWISTIYPSDSSFRLVSWQLFVHDDRYTYHGFIQKADGTLYDLNDQVQPIDDLEYELITPDHWYGALYYNVEQFNPSNGQAMYVVFGYDANDRFNRRKIVDVLTFENGDPIFGKDIFIQAVEESRPIVRNRLLLTYSADASVTVHYNADLGMIIFDHLIARIGHMEGQGMTLFPDGSYHGYAYQDGQWLYKSRIFDDLLDDAPVKQPTADDKGTDIFGQSKRKSSKKRKSKKD